MKGNVLCLLTFFQHIIHERDNGTKVGITVLKLSKIETSKHPVLDILSYMWCTMYAVTCGVFISFYSALDVPL